MKISTRFILAAITAVILAPAYAELPEVIPPSSTTGPVMPPVSGPLVTASSAPVTVGAPVPPSTTTDAHPHHKHSGIRVSLNLDDESFPSLSFKQDKHHSKHHEPYWIATRAGEPVPVNAVIGGGSNHSGHAFYVCRGQYHGGVHPGKLTHGNCNIAWGNREISLLRYEVLVS